MDSFGKFSDDTLPDRCEFFSSLEDESINKKTIYMLLMFFVKIKSRR